MRQAVEKNEPVAHVVARYTAMGIIHPENRKPYSILMEARTIWLDSFCRPPVYRPVYRSKTVPKGPSPRVNGDDGKTWPPPGWSVPSTHPKFNPAIHEAIELPAWVPPAPDIDFSCD